MSCSRRHSIQCVMTADSQPVVTSSSAAAAAAASASQSPQPPVASPYRRRLSMVDEQPRTIGSRSSAVARRRKMATSSRLHGSSIAALAAAARTPILIGAVNNRKKSLPDIMPFDDLHELNPSSQHRKVLYTLTAASFISITQPAGFPRHLSGPDLLLAGPCSEKNVGAPNI